MRAVFTRDNTQGYSDEQLAELNRRFAEQAADLDPSDPSYADARQTLAERVLAEFDGGPTPDAGRLRAWLAAHGRSQRGLARELDVADRTVRYWCSGEQPVPRIVWLALETLSRRPST